MKKLVAISVLFAGLATAVFAQSGGWSNEWKVGFSAKFITEMFYAASVSGKSEKTQDTTPVDGTSFASDGTNTWSKESGKYNKGTMNFFGNQRRLADQNVGGDDRLMISLENSGENYSVWVNMSADRTNPNWNGGGWDWLGHEYKLWDFFTIATILDDFGIKGTAGIFELGVGSKPVESSWVSTNATWGSWIASNDLNRFGVMRWSSNAAGSIIHSDHFRTLEQWGEAFMVGITPVDNFKFAFGYTLLNNWGSWKPNDGNPKDNKSSINGTFMFSGRPADVITFDLFYAIKGSDGDTFSRPATAFGYNAGNGFWKNLIGAYVGINGIENLAVSVGYTVNFNAYEVDGFLCADGDYTQSKPVTYNAPIYSGIDLRLGFTGIDKIGLKFNNRISFAGVNGDKVAKDTSATADLHERVYKDKINLLFDENKGNARADGDGRTQTWFNWQSVLQANLGFIDGVGLEVAFLERLGVFGNNLDRTEPPLLASDTITKKTVTTRTETNNEFRATVGAKYGVGNVNLGIALFLQISSTLVDDVTTVTTTDSAGGTPIVKKTTFKSNEDVVKFGIPITFQVSF